VLKQSLTKQLDKLHCDVAKSVAMGAEPAPKKCEAALTRWLFCFMQGATVLPILCS
jgi:hypothetical protein